MTTSRKGFIQGLACASLLSAGNCFAIVRNPKQKVRLAAVGLMGFGYHAWTSLLRTGLVELVALCDADADVLNSVNSRAKKEFPDLDFSKIPFYTDYRKLLDDAEKLGIDAMTVATPDHAHGPITIQAMKKGIHVLVEFPLVRTLWELNCFDKTARENGVVVQMGNGKSGINRKSTRS